MKTKSECPPIIKVKRACPCCGRKDKVRKDFDSPKTMRCCDDCGADFIIDGEIIFDPRTHENF